MIQLPSKLSLALGFFGAALALSPSLNAQFVNGGFDNGSTSGWTVGNGNRGGASLASLVPASYLNNNTGRSAIVTPGLDPEMGALMANIVYAGSHSYRVEDRAIGGLLSVVSQTVVNYTDPNIFFAWMAVLEGAHGPTDSAAMIITLRDLTFGDTLISRIYNAGGVPDPARFSFALGNYYTPVWQIEQLAIDVARAGHTFELTVLATDCGPTGHMGYVYLDGFGNVTPPVTPPVDNVAVPEPSTYGLIGAAALLGAVLYRRRKQAAARA